MKKELSKDLLCLLTREGIEIWFEKSKIREVEEKLEYNKFINIDGNTISVSNVSGLFTAQAVEEMRRRKNGEWKCKYDYWHSRGDQCGHGELKKY